MKTAALTGAILGGIAGAAVGQGPGLLAGGLVGSIEALVVVGLVKHFGAPAWQIVMATLKAVLLSVVFAFIAWLFLMGMFQQMAQRG
jgi:hypothetical protein